MTRFSRLVPPMFAWRIALGVGLAALLLLALPRSALAHGGDTTYVVLTPHRSVIDGTVSLDLVDEEGILRVSRQDLIAGRRREVVATYVGSHLLLDDGAPCPLTVDAGTTDVDLNALRLTMKFRAECGHAIERVNVDFEIFFDAAVYYLGIVRLDGAASATQLFTSSHRTGTFVLSSAQPSPAGATVHGEPASQVGGFSLPGLASAGRAGVEHIWSGADHLLFLLALLMTAVVERVPGGWAPREGLRASLLDVAKIVTGFTVTHSITLSLAAFDLLHPAPRIIEPAIAASVAVAALDNVHPFLRGRKWVIASTLGLLHGFGFASGLKELSVPHHSLVETLLGFAVGVEAGQFLFVLLFVPTAFLLRKTTFYRRFVVPVGSCAIIALALLWMVQRALPRGSM